MRVISKILKNCDGVSAIEYGLIATIISIAALSSLEGLRNQLSSPYNTVAATMQNSTTAN